jgi:protein-disulfide isomerase
MATNGKWLAVLGCFTAVHAQDGTKCAPVTAELRDNITRYIDKVLKAPEGKTLDVKGWSLERDSCYRRLEVSVGGQRTIALYLSPDQRFLTSQLFDSHIDPAAAEAAEAARISGLVNAHIARRNTPILGESSAPITVAVFSDFQCPYCKKAMRTLEKEVLPSSAGVRIAYLNYPLPSHSWARPAAELATCLGSGQGFWKLHDFLYEHQSELNPRNVSTRLAEFLELSPEAGSDIRQFTLCMGSKEPARGVDEDVALGNSLSVSSTPTLFINGQRVVGAQRADEIKLLISRLDSGVK